jgi:putative salt-induced outer membrane protein YdiY
MIHGVRTRPSVLILMLAAMGAAVPALAQAPPPEPPPRVEGSAQFTFLNTNGNADTQSLGTGGEMVWRPGVWTHTAKLAFAQNETDGLLSARSLTGLFRASRQLRERLSVYGQYDYLRDVFAGVEQRHVAEVGVSFRAVDSGRQRLRLDGGFGYMNEVGPDDELNTATLSAAAQYRLALSATSEFTYEPRYLLTLSDTGAWKFGQEATLAVAINSVMGLKLSHIVRYSADPPFGFETTDTIMAVSLVAKVKRP